MRIIHISLTAIFAALYAVGVVALAPISFMLFQVRVADALLPLSMLFGWPAIVGFSLGALIGNVYGGLGLVDMAGGAAANFAGCSIAYAVTRGSLRRGNYFIGCWIINLTITFTVGTYLAYLLGFPVEVGWLGVFIGSVVAINLCGFFLLQAVRRTKLHVRPKPS